MDLSFALPTSGSWAIRENVAAIARAADERRCRGLWTFQRLLYPITNDLASVYHTVLDPLVCLGFAASLTRRSRLGLAVVNGPFFAPAVLAKQLTTIDLLSDGRLDAGIGLGWHPTEYAAVGLPMEGRGRRFDEWLDCLNALLTQDEVSFSGEFYTVPPSRLEPKAVQRPRPPLLIGGSSDVAYRRAGSRGDGWISSSRARLDDIKVAVTAVRDAAERAGKPRESVRCVVRGVTVLRDAPNDQADRRPLSGSLEQIREDLERFAEVGVDELFFDLNFDSEQVGSPKADAAAAMDKAYAVLEGCIPS